MSGPDQRLFDADVQSAGFRASVLKGRWDLAGPEAQPDDMVWPKAIVWLAAASRPGAPHRYYLILDLKGYRTAPPTGTFWNSAKKGLLEQKLRPRGKPNSRFERVFRTDWESGRAFYHPYDRVAAESHKHWLTELPHLIWTADLTIVDWLEEFQSLLMSEDYIGLSPDQ